MTTKQLSQNELVLSHMKRYGSITSLDAEAMYGIARLAARIKDLRDLYGHHKIKTETVKFVHWYTGHPGTYARYTMTGKLTRG